MAFRKNITLLLNLIITTVGLSQEYFNPSATYDKVQRQVSENPIAVVDVDGDFLDDIVSLNPQNDLYVLYQTPSGAFEKILIANAIFEGESYSITVGDFNRDGKLDLVVSGETVPMLFYQEKRDQFRRDFADFNPFVAQSANSIDIDLDGKLDLFVCNDNGLSNTYKNTGNTLEPFPFLDMTTATASDNSGNYSTVWLDVESDGDLDLYIGKCRAGVDDATDPRRINALYIQEDGIFTEEAKAYGIDVGRQTWSTSTGDVDNDGDEDILITNHYSDCQLLINQGQYFDKMDLGLLDVFGIQGLFMDVNLDGWQDLIISTLSEEILLLNQGNYEFVEDRKPLGKFDRGSSISLGDLNNDGVTDLLAQRAGGDFDQIFWGTNPDNNHFLQISLSSNQDVNGIGAEIELYGPWGVQSQRIVAGESYGITRSLQRNFGLEKHEFADSLIVRWMNGNISRHYNLLANQKLNIKENGCIEQIISLEQSLYNICDQNGILITLPEGYDTYVWMDFVLSQERFIEEGIYSARMQRSDGCLDILSPIQGKLNAAPQTLISSKNSSLCNGKSIELTCPEEGIYAWNTQASTQTIEINTSGKYQLTFTDVCQQEWRDTIVILSQNVEAPDDIQDTILKGERDTLNFNHLTLVRNPVDHSILSYSPQFITPVLDTFTSFLFSNIDIANSETSITGLDILSNSFASDQVNSGILFDVYTPLVLNSIEVYTEDPGERLFQLLDIGGQVLQEQRVFLNSGSRVVDLKFFIEEGLDYVLKTDMDTNLRNLGSIGPKLARTPGNQSTSFFPFSLNNIIELKNTLNGRQNYYYFYNWRIQHDLAYCESDPALASIQVRDPLSNTNLERNPFEIYPNPSTEFLNISGPTSVIKKVVFLNIQGRSVLESQKLKNIDLTSLKKGVYFCMIQSENNVHTSKIIKL